MLFLDGPGRQYLPRQPATLQSQHNFLKIFPSHDEILNIFSMTFEEKIIISDNIKQQKKTFNGKLLNYSSQAENLKEK